MSDILPVSMQDFLYSRKSELREQIIFLKRIVTRKDRSLAASGHLCV